MADEPLERREIEARLRALRGWSVSADGKSIAKELLMRDFLAAVELIGKIAEIAEKSDHHPDLHLTSYRRLRIELSTHSAGGLTGRDFALAAAVDALPKSLKA